MCMLPLSAWNIQNECGWIHRHFCPSCGVFCCEFVRERTLTLKRVNGCHMIGSSRRASKPACPPTMTSTTGRTRKKGSDAFRCYWGGGEEGGSCVVHGVDFTVDLCSLVQAQFALNLPMREANSRCWRLCVSSTQFARRPKH